MSLKQKALNTTSGIFRKTIKTFGGKWASQISAQISEDLIPVVRQNTKFGPIDFYCPGVIPTWRATTLLTKEPETLEWIDGFATGDVLWDIGANVGVYTMYAARKGHSVIAFEPSANNYFLLGKNTEINHLIEHVWAYCIAFSNKTGLDAFYMSSTEMGSALNSFGTQTDWQGKPFEAKMKQAMVGYTVDDFIHQFTPEFPNHIKIDVDGIEDLIIEGAQKTLADSRVKSLLLELDTERIEYCERVMAIIEKSGLVLEKREHAAHLDDTPFKKVFNHIFIRKN